MKKMNTPIYNAIRKYIDSKPTPFHMPGHKLGSFFDAAAKKQIFHGRCGEFSRNISSKNYKKYLIFREKCNVASKMQTFHEDTLNFLKMDVTEIPGLDNLHKPEGVILEAQTIAAKAFKADKSFMLVNGSSSGILAAIMAVCNPKDKIIIQRNSHKAVFNALTLSEAKPVYVFPEYEESFGILKQITSMQFEEVISHNLDAKAIVITRPDYYGQCCDLKKIVKCAHENNMIVIVDEAHGAHLSFSEKLPDSAMECGADICVQSAHKTLPALTQGAWLHIKGGRVNEEKISECISMFQTTSPSYLIMSFLDISREIMEIEGEKKLSFLVEEFDKFIQKVCMFKGLKVFSNVENDITRLVINVSELGISGFQAEEFLWKNNCIRVEMADLQNLVCICTIADSKLYFEKLISGLEELCDFYHNESIKNVRLECINYNDICNNKPSIIMSFMEAFRAEKEKVRLIDSVGKICANHILPYPPGIPIVCAGEIIDVKVVNYINEIISLGGNVIGLDNGMVSVCKILDN